MENTVPMMMPVAARVIVCLALMILAVPALAQEESGRAGTRESITVRGEVERTATRRSVDGEARNVDRSAANLSVTNTVGAGARAAATDAGAARANVGAARASSSNIASRAPAPTVRFEARPTGVQPILHFRPAHLVVQEGEIAEVELVLHNPQSVMAERLQLALQYDPQLIRLTRVDATPLAEYLESPPLIQFDPRSGVVSIEAFFRRPYRRHQQALIRFGIEALQPIPHTSLAPRQFAFGGRDHQVPSALYAGTRNILGAPRVRDDGIIPLGIEITVDPSSTAQNQASSLAQEIQQAADPVLFGRGARGGISLRLKTETREVRVGDVFDIDIEMYNPALSGLDAVRLAIQYDPTVLEIVDYDDHNVITRGINIREGSRRLFPFDFQVANEVNPLRGRIEYRMGVTSTPQWPRIGTLATIRARALRPTRSTTVAFVVPGPLERGTTVSFIGRDVLGSPDDDRDGMENLTLRIVE